MYIIELIIIILLNFLETKSQPAHTKLTGIDLLFRSMVALSMIKSTHNGWAHNRLRKPISQWVFVLYFFLNF